MPAGIIANMSAEHATAAPLILKSARANRTPERGSPETETPRPQQEDYRPWKDRVAAELARRHGISAGEIRERVWRNLFILRKTLEE